MKLLKSILTCMALATASICPAAPVLLMNGNFEAPVQPINAFLAVGTSIPGWTVIGLTGHNVHQVAAGPLNWPADTTQFLDLTGNTGGAGIRSDPFMTTPGLTYRITFNALNGSLVDPGSPYTGPVLSVQASGGPLASYNGLVDLPAGQPQVLSYLFAAISGSTTLTLMDISGFDSNAGWIDNVAIEVIPEPGTIAIISISLLPSAIRLRLLRKRAKHAE